MLTCFLVEHTLPLSRIIALRSWQWSTLHLYSLPNSHATCCTRPAGGSIQRHHGRGVDRGVSAVAARLEVSGKISSFWRLSAGEGVLCHTLECSVTTLSRKECPLSCAPCHDSLAWSPVSTSSVRLCQMSKTDDYAPLHAPQQSVSDCDRGEWHQFMSSRIVCFQHQYLIHEQPSCHLTH